MGKNSKSWKCEKKYKKYICIEGNKTYMRDIFPDFYQHPEMKNRSIKVIYKF